MAEHTDGSSICVVGSINMDLVARCARLAQPGETVIGDAFATVPGGKGANQAIAAARAGGGSVEVAMIGAVGRDTFADPLIATLTAAGVGTALVRRVPGASGIAQISVDASAENCIIVVPGANGTVTALDGADQAAITAASLVLLQLEIPMDGVILAAQAAATAGVSVLLNPSPVQLLPPELVDAVTILVVNEGEAAALGPELLDAMQHVVTTFGARGARYRGPDGLRIDVAAPAVHAIDTTGAGDAFTGALAVAWVAGLEPVAALRRACAAGALAATVVGASASSPTRQEIDNLVAATY